VNVDGAGSGGASVNLHQSVIIDVRCKYTLTMQLAAAAATDNASSSIMMDSLVFIPDYRRSSVYTTGRLNSLLAFAY